MLTLAEFTAGNRNFVVVVNDREVFSSTKSDLQPLLDYLTTDRGTHTNPILFDRYIGRAAALLMTLLEPSKVFTPVISKGGKAALEEYEIPFEIGETVEYLMGVASDGMCRWEKMALGKSPSEFFELLRNQ